MSKLFEHRGKPDPAKVREREEAHKRGLLRSKHAREAEREQQMLKRQRELQKKLKEKNTGDAIKQQNMEIEQKQKVDTHLRSINKNAAESEKHIIELQDGAPSEQSQQVAKSISLDLKDFQEKLKSELVENIQQQQQTADHEKSIQSKFDEIESTIKSKKLSKSDMEWFRKTLNGAKNAMLGFVGSAISLMGFGDIYSSGKDAIRSIFNVK